MLLLELGARALDPWGLAYVFEHERFLLSMPSHPLYAYTAPPNSHEVYQGVSLAINRHGFRGPDFSMPKTSDRPRLVLLGDSVVLGWGVAWEQTLCPQLQRALPDWEVVGLGVNSWNTRNQAEYLRVHGSDLAADAMVWIIVSNDVAPKIRGAHSVNPAEFLPIIKPTTPGRRAWQWLARRSYLAGGLQRQLGVAELRQQLNWMYRPESAEARDAADAFHLVVDYAQQRRIPLLGYLYFMHGERNSPLGRGFERLYGDLFQAHHLEYRVFPEEIYRPGNLNSATDPHQNARGLALMAEVIVQQFQQGGAHLPRKSAL